MKRLRILILLMLGAAFSTSAQTLDLPTAISKALANNYGVQSIQKTEEIANIRNTWGQAGRYPTISLGANGGANWQINDTNNSSTYSASASVDMNWIVFNGFSVRINKAILNANSEFAAGNVMLQFENTIYSVISAFYGILVQQELLEVNEKLMKLSEDRYEQSKLANELGTSGTYDLLQAQNSWLEDKSNFLNQEVTVKNAIRSLNYIMGETSNIIWTLDGDIEVGLNEYALADVQQKMYSSNRTLKNQYINQRLRAEETKLSNTAFMPTVSFNAGASTTWSDPENVSNPAMNVNPYANVALSYNIFNGKKNRIALESAKLNEEVEALNTEDIKLSLSNQLLQMMDSYSVNKELYTLAKEQEKAAALNLQISEDKYKSGAINSFNYRDVQVLYVNASVAKYTAMYNLVMSDIDLLQITGGIVTEYK